MRAGTKARGLEVAIERRIRGQHTALVHLLHVARCRYLIFYLCLTFYEETLLLVTLDVLLR
jgi:hypothetical protein